MQITHRQTVLAAVITGVLTIMSAYAQQAPASDVPEFALGLLQGMARAGESHG